MATRARNGSARQRGGPADAAFEAPGSGDESPPPRPRARTGSTTRGGSGTGSRGGSASRGSAGSRSGGNARRGANSKPGRGTTARSGKKKNVKRSTGRGRPAKGRPARRPADPVVILIQWTGRAIAAAWMVVAGALGFAVRAIGRGARDLDPHHRRDGLGLLTLGVAIVLGAGLWGRMGNPAGRAIRTVLEGAFGSRRLGGAAARRAAGLAFPAPSRTGTPRRPGPRSAGPRCCSACSA